MNILYKNRHLKGLLLSYAQIFFSSNAAFGAGLMITTFINPAAGLTAMLSALVVNLIAEAAGYDKDRIASGFYGFTGFLLGAGYSYFFIPSLQGYFYLAVLLAASVYISAFMQNYIYNSLKTGAFTLPFLIAFYLLFAILLYSGQQMQDWTYEADPFSLNLFLEIYFKSLGFILLQKELITGIVIAVLLLIYSRVLFALSLLAYSVAFLLGYIMHADINEGVMIFAGFNSILTAFAVGGCMVIPSRSSLITGFFGVILASFITVLSYDLFSGIGLPILVLPFNIAAIIILSALYYRTNGLHPQLLYFLPGSPEENLYYHLTRRSRFEKFKYYFPELPFYGEWSVSQGVNGSITHKNAWGFAWDFVITDKKQSQFDNHGYELKDYYCYDAPVTAPLDGRVVEVINTVPENIIGEANLKNNWGNTIIIDHYEGLYSALCHLKQNSAKVSPGDYVKKGDIIASCGNSGRSPYPHLHFQFQLTPKIGEKTYYYPLSHFVEQTENGWLLKNFDSPAEGTVVSNLEADRMMTSAFHFSLGDAITVKGKVKGKEKKETWTVHVTIYNELYLLSTSGDIAYIYNTGKVFYLSNYVGSKSSLIYYFYLASLQVPLTAKEHLHWSDKFSPAHYPDSLQRILSEAFVFFYNKIEAESSFILHKPQPDMVKIESDIHLKSMLSSQEKKRYKTSLIVTKSRGISSIAIYKDSTPVAELEITEYERNTL